MTVIIEIAKVQETERGMGITCGHEGCGCKWIMSITRLRERVAKELEGDPGDRLAAYCPACGRLNRIVEP